MLVRSDEAMAGMLACPSCRAALTCNEQAGWACSSEGCARSGSSFERVGGVPVIVDYDRSVLDRDVILASGGESVVARGGGLRRRIFRAIDGENPITPRYSRQLIRELERMGQAEGRRTKLLIVGGGTIGSGADALYASADVDVLAFDIYASPNVSMVADAHAMPIADASVDAVWIQAVLEHVLDPATVVSEILRVLRPGGLVFADTPFLWPVHEKAYDFTRWTASGHRWLFRDFEVLAAGTSSGPGTASLITLRYLAASLFRSSKMGQILTFPLLWLRMLDRFCDARRGVDAAGGLFFYGRKAQAQATARELIAFYDAQVPLQDRALRPAGA